MTINSTELEKVVVEYQQYCKRKQRKPSYHGLGKRLEISPHTVRNVCLGGYNGIPYAKEPLTSRRIDNADFETIRNVFDNVKALY